MGYNSCYGLLVNDDMTRYDESTGEQLSFFESDIFGNLLVKQEYGHCADCGAPLNGQRAYLHGNVEICEKCELKRRMKDRKFKINTKKNNSKKAVTK